MIKDFCQDNFRLQQVLSNLISNSIKYSYSGIIQLKAKTMYTLKGKIGVIKVSDQGIGVKDTSAIG